MRLFLLENYTKHDFNITEPDELDALVKFARENCAKALNEFYRTNNYLYRGLSGIDGNSAYVIPTKESRKPFGTSTKGKTGASFNGWLSKNGHVRRDKNVAFTTSSTPENYNGIHNDEWFYFMPVGDYHYTYINTVQGGDFNLHSWVQKSLGTFQYFEEMIDELEGSINRANYMLRGIERDSDVDFDDLIYVNDIIKKVTDINKEAQQMIMDVAMLYQKGIFSDDNMEKLKPYMEFFKSLDEKYEGVFNMMHSAEEKLDDDSAEHEIVSSFEFAEAVQTPWFMIRSVKNNIDSDETYTMMNALMQSFATDKITPHFDDNEIVVQCNSYLVIPYSMGEEFIKKLLG